ncbi:hypothetical protein BN1221_03788 [Brenneria goodwinii]|uniref:Uncharacterized protein n=1 Tax=Brenneria goodwinii TaxID=1109412 RepID=A0A0G4JZA2_9GAMM|nr:hypothetical protein BN1221_03788 [Brenneria goodwinii]
MKFSVGFHAALIPAIIYPNSGHEMDVWRPADIELVQRLFNSTEIRE